MLNLQHTSIDSFKYKINLGFVEFSEKGKEIFLDPKAIINLNTGELEELFKSRSYLVPDDTGISTRFAVANEKIGTGEGEVREVFVMMLNSKILKEKYLHGITSKTISHVYDYIMSLDLFYIEYDSFLKMGWCVDVDVKADFKHFSRLKTERLMKGLYSVYPSADPPKTSVKNTGIQFSRRSKDASSISFPFIKFYHKGTELIYHSSLFATTYLKKSSAKNLMRLEGTIKDKQHLLSLAKSVGAKCPNNSLCDLLSFSSSDLQQMLSTMLNKHFKTSGKCLNFMEQFTSAELNEKQRLILGCIKAEIINGGSIDTFSHSMLQNEHEKTRYRKKKIYLDLYKAHLLSDNQIVDKNNFRAILSDLLNLGKIS